jgi:protein SCO1/2
MRSDRRLGWACSGLIASLTALSLLACGESDGVPVWGTLPEFVLLDQNSQPFGSEQLHGKPWLADFIFTQCPGRCPMLTREMARIQAELRRRDWGDVQLVSISVDPEHDTPKVLGSYAQKHGAAQDSWSFLTGEREEIWALSVDGFKLPVANSESVSGPILHSNKFVLADRMGRIRGYYDALDERQRAKLLDDLERVRAEGIPEAG